MKHVSSAIVAAVSAALAAASPLAASDRDVLATTVPAPACQAANPNSQGMLRLVNGAWAFLPGVTGTAYLWCPVDFNKNTKSDNTDDNEITGGFRILYRDSDAAGNEAQVTARLGYRIPSGHNWVAPEWASAPGVTGNTASYSFVFHDLQPGLYSFQVTLTRTNTVEDPAFSGIDFFHWTPPVVGL